jgi:hypothetical protein
MNYLGLNIGYSPGTFRILCRAFSAVLAEPSASGYAAQIRATVRSITQKYLVGAASVQEDEALPE